MSPRILAAADAFWRPSNQMGVLNTDLAKQLEAQTIAARLWRLAPRQASTKHRHVTQTELYVLLEGSGRIRIGDDACTLQPLSSALVEPEVVRQIFNDTEDDALWARRRRASGARQHARDDARTAGHALPRQA